MKCYKREASHLPHRARRRASEVDAFAYTVLLVVSYAMTSERIKAYAREPRSRLNSRVGMRYLNSGRSREGKERA